MTNPFTELQNRIGEINEKSGFNQAKDIPEEYRDLYWDRKLLLVISEIAEAQDEMRSGHAVDERYESYPPVPPSLAVEFASGADATEHWENSQRGKPEGTPSEMADAVIRLIGVAHEAKFDLFEVIFHKLDYNETRGYRHGKQF